MKIEHWNLLRWTADLLILTAAFLLSNLAKWALPIGQQPDPGTSFVTPMTLALLLATWSICGRVTGLYHPRQTATLPVELQRVVFTMIVGVIIIAGLFLFLQYHFFSRLLLVYLFGSAIGGMAVFRLVLWKTWQWWRARGYGVRRVIIVGDGASAETVIEAMKQNPWHSYEFVGLVADAASANGLPTLGGLDGLKRIVCEKNVHEVIVPEGERELVPRVVEGLQTVPVSIKVVPDYLELMSATASVDIVGGVPLLELRAPAIDGFDAFLKRGLDVVVSLLALVAALPLMIVVALMVKLSSPGPVLFRQERVGANSRAFTIWKFRSMLVGAPASPPVPEDPAELGQSRIKAAADDQNITSLGRILRRYALDELPQFVNVLKGDMSLVGPRPEVTPVVEMYSHWHLKRLSMRPGMTGPMQIAGGSELALDDRVRLELAYMKNYAVWEDLKILSKTLGTVIGGKGVH